MSITESPREISVVDNASFYNSAEIAEAYNQVTLLRSPADPGLARANNIGAVNSSGSSILFLNPDTAGTDKPSIVDWLVGAAMWLTPVERERVGLMSKKHFLYFEDVEWCMRVREAGMGVWFVPETVIRHDSRRESAGGSMNALWLHLRSMVRFFSEHLSVTIGKHEATPSKKERNI